MNWKWKKVAGDIASEIEQYWLERPLSTEVAKRDLERGGCLFWSLFSQTIFYADQIAHKEKPERKDIFDCYYPAIILRKAYWPAILEVLDVKATDFVSPMFSVHRILEHDIKYDPISEIFGVENKRDTNIPIVYLSAMSAMLTIDHLHDIPLFLYALKKLR